MTVDVPDDCAVVSREAVKFMIWERDQARKQLEQALAKIQDLESRLAEKTKPQPDLFAPCYIPAEWADCQWL